MSGGVEEEGEREEGDGNHFFVQKCFHSDSARFEDVPIQYTLSLDYCVPCAEKKRKEKVRMVSCHSCHGYQCVCICRMKCQQ